MKKPFLSLLIFLFGFHATSYSFYQQKNRCVPSFRHYFSLGNELLAAVKTNTPDKLLALLNQVAAQYRGNPQGFFQVMDTRDNEGFNIMHLAAVTGDLENMNNILNTVDNFYGSDTQGKFRYLTTRDTKGLSLLGLVEYIGNRNIFEQILMRTMQMLDKNKKMFFEFLNIGTIENNWKPLADAVYDSQTTNVEMMIKLGAYVLGKRSDYFYQFLNATDVDGLNALSYADNPRIRFLLLNYGAQLPKKNIKQNPRLPEVNRFGLELMQASNLNNFAYFQQILSKAKNYKDDPNLLFFFFSARNGAGWNPFINVAADGQYKYLKTLLEAIDELFPEGSEEDKLELLSNADFEARTPLHFAVSRRHFKVAKLIIDTIVRYSANKPYLFATLNTPNELNGYNPFIDAVYEHDQYDKPTYEFIVYFIEKMIELFGRDSRMLYLFINVREYNHWTPLSYATDPKLIKLLKSYGAINTPMKHYKGIGEFNRMLLRGIV